MKDAFRAEWTKLCTMASTFWLLLAAATLTVTLSAAASAARCPSGHCADDPAKISLTGIYLGQAVVAVLAVTAVSGEYGTGMIRVTLTAMPRRLTVLAPRQPSSPAWSWSPGRSPSSARCWPGGSSCPATASARPTATRRSPR